jgi:hypothetical protein
MKYENKELTVDQLVGYLKDRKINLSPIFQRNRVWSLTARRALIKNILRHMPIPAIFIYKDDTQSEYRYEYSILDGKQRLESIMMFIGESNEHMSIPTVKEYIFDRAQQKNIGFSVNLGDGRGNIRFKSLREELKKLGEYPIATIYVTIDEASQLDEVINLFVDINQRGEKVTRLDIVKAMKRKDPFLEELFSLIATREERKQDVYVKWKGSNFVSVLKRLQTISRITERSVRADRMWQILVELALYVRSNGQHRKPSEILKTFIKSAKQPEKQLTEAQRRKLVSVFSFLHAVYKSPLSGTKLATDYTHFYIMATTLLDGKLATKTPEERTELVRKLISFSRHLSSDPDTISNAEIKSYVQLSARQTTDAEKRKERQRLFLNCVNAE